jgi:hypothetical protein
MDFISGEKLTAAKLNNVLQSTAHAYQTSTQTLTTATWTAITMNAEAYDPKGFHSTSSNTARFTPTVAGRYKCFGMVAFAGDTVGDRAAQFRKNGAQTDELPYGPMPAMNGTGLVAGAAFAMGTVALNGSTDYVELYGIHNKGSNLATFYSSLLSGSYWIIERIGD